MKDALAKGAQREEASARFLERWLMRPPCCLRPVSRDTSDPVLFEVEFGNRLVRAWDESGILKIGFAHLS